MNESLRDSFGFWDNNLTAAAFFCPWKSFHYFRQKKKKVFIIPEMKFIKQHHKKITHLPISLAQFILVLVCISVLRLKT